MPIYTIRPRDRSFASTEIETSHAAEVFNIVDRLKCGEADVERDEAYSFSLRQIEGGAWVIFHRSAAEVAPWPEDGAAPGRADVPAMSG